MIVTHRLMLFGPVSGAGECQAAIAFAGAQTRSRRTFVGLRDYMVMNFTLLCGTLLVAVSGQHAELSDRTKASQNWGVLYADHVFLAATDQAGVYENDLNFQLRIAPDHSRIWLNKNDGAGLRCQKHEPAQD